MKKSFVRRRMAVTRYSQNQKKSSESTPNGRFSKIEKFFKSILTITVALIAFIMFIIFIAESLRDVIIVESFEIPQKLIGKGYSKDALMNKIGDHFYEMNQTIHNQYRGNKKLIISLNKSIVPPSLEIPSTNINISSFIHFLRNVTGLSPRRVRIEIVLQDKEGIKLTVRIKNSSTTPYYEKIDIPCNKAQRYTINQIDEVLKKTAIHIATYTEPYLTGVYFTAAGKSGDALKVADLLLKKTEKRFKLQGYYLKTLAYLSQEDYQNAIRNFEKAIPFASKELSKVAIYTNWGGALFLEGKLEEAYEKLQEALKYDPENAMIHYNCGFILTEQKNYKRAIKKFQQAIDIDKNYVKAYFFLGFCYMELGKSRKAIEYFDKAQELGYKDTQIYIFAARGYFELQDKENACSSLHKLKDLNENTRKQLEDYINKLMEQKKDDILEDLLKCIENLIQKDSQLENLKKIVQEKIKISGRQGINGNWDGASERQNVDENGKTGGGT